MLPPHSLCCAHDGCIHHKKCLDGLQGPPGIVLRCHINLFWCGPFRNKFLATRVSCEFMDNHLAGQAKSASDTQFFTFERFIEEHTHSQAKLLTLLGQRGIGGGVCLALSSDRKLPGALLIPPPASFHPLDFRISENTTRQKMKVPTQICAMSIACPVFPVIPHPRCSPYAPIGSHSVCCAISCTEYLQCDVCAPIFCAQVNLHITLNSLSELFYPLTRISTRTLRCTRIGLATVCLTTSAEFIGLTKDAGQGCLLARF
jgi:hypothetical protein